MADERPPMVDELLARTERADLSALLTLRALALREKAGEGWVSCAALVDELERELTRLGAAPETGLSHASRPWEQTPQPSEEERNYLHEHVARMLADQGLVELRGTSGDGLEGSSVRLAPALRARRDALQERVERRIRVITEAPTTQRAVREPTPGGSTLAASGLVKVYRKRKVVNNVDLHVTQGEIVGLLGPNGAGKTTTFYMMVGLIAPDAGRVTIGKEDVTDTPMFRRARKGIGYLAQEPSIFRKLTVEENVRAILQMMGLSKEEQQRRLEVLLDELGIKHLRHSKAYALSGGERRRLEITRALVGRPKFMLLDEPFAGVDPIAVHDIQQIVADLRQRNIGVLISDHNVEQTLDIVDRAYIMYEGRVRVSGTVSELVWNDEVAEIYLGPTLTARMRQRYTNPE
ncbi:MAG TPA: LPS export ABC transporter ATP-binding protein [Longimicrobiaceae bacterium]